MNPWHAPGDFLPGVGHVFERVATGQHDDDELASLSTSAPAHSASTARSAGLSYLQSPQALSLRGPSALLCDELAFQMTRATAGIIINIA
jgi:hypothetical protein